MGVTKWMFWGDGALPETHGQMFASCGSVEMVRLPYDTKFVLASDHDAEAKRLKAEAAASGEEIKRLKENLRQTENLLASSQEMVRERDAQIKRLEEENRFLRRCGSPFVFERVDVPSASEVVDEIAKRLRR